MQLKFRKVHKDAKMPEKAHETDAAFDLVAVSLNKTKNYFEYDTGLVLEIPKNFSGLIYPRSSISKLDLVLCNSVGVIDAGFRGTIKLRFKVLNNEPCIYSVGDRIGQLRIVPVLDVSFVEDSSMSDTVRGIGGFGSTGE